VVGLLLLLGLFWFWASSLIGDDDETPATPSTAAIIVTQEAPTPTQTIAAAITPAETVQTDAGTGNGSETAEPTPTEVIVESTGGTFEVGDLVAVTDDGVNLRSEPTTNSEAVEQLNIGDQLRITGPPEEDDTYIWWPVEDEANNLSGWIAENFLEPGE
jgi:hypothetical protein